ncbi:MAG: ABC transporter permease [Oscillospiraceae bacterium]|nr:ABC transporter permease [Oscillospiraceae bacterium]
MFNLKLYKEALRRSAFLAGLFLAILLLGATLLPAAMIQSQLRDMAHGWQGGAVAIDGIATNFALFLAMPAFAPILTLFLFSFLNKRNSSDFYHAIPHKREAIFGSFLAAIVTWVIGGIWLCTGITLAIFSLAPAGVAIINFSSVLLTALGITVGCLLVIAAVLIAMSVTGTTFSNIATAGLILFLPRILLVAFTQTVMDATRFVISPETFGILGDSSHNIPFSFVWNILSTPGGMSDAFVYGILYTFVLALIYFAIAIVLFKRRRSETASNPAQSSILQNMIRIALAFVVCIPAMILLSVARYRSGDNLVLLISIYALAVVAYFAYELISTKKLSNIKKALPGLGILAVLNVVFVVGAIFTGNAILNRDIPPAQVASVRIQTNTFHSNWGDEHISYQEIRAREVSIEDERLAAFLVETFEHHLGVVRGGGSFFDHPWGNNVIHQHTVFFEMQNGRTIRRNILFDEEADRTLSELLSTHPVYTEAFLSLPEDPAEIMAHTSLSPEAVVEIYAALREEVRGLELTEWNAISRGWGWDMAFPEDAYVPVTYGSLNIRGFAGTQTYTGWLPVTSLTPRAAELFVRHSNAESRNHTELALEHLLAGTLTGYWINMQSLNPHGLVSRSFEEWDSRSGGDYETLVPLLLDAIRAQGNTPLDAEKTHLSIHISAWLEEIDAFVNATFFFHTDNEELLTALGWRGERSAAQDDAEFYFEVG